MNCAACDRSPSSGLWCERHASAVKNLLEGYSIWVKAYGKLSWEKYLDEIINNKKTGNWVLEVAKIADTLDLPNK